MRRDQGEGAWSWRRHHLNGGLGGNFSTGDKDWFPARAGGKDFKGAGSLLTQETRGGEEGGGGSYCGYRGCSVDNGEGLSGRPEGERRA